MMSHACRPAAGSPAREAHAPLHSQHARPRRTEACLHSTQPRCSLLNAVAAQPTRGLHAAAVTRSTCEVSSPSSRSRATTKRPPTTRSMHRDDRSGRGDTGSARIWAGFAPPVAASAARTGALRERGSGVERPAATILALRRTPDVELRRRPGWGARGREPAGGGEKAPPESLLGERATRGPIWFRLTRDYRLYLEKVYWPSNAEWQVACWPATAGCYPIDSGPSSPRQTGSKP